ncbi:MAG: cytochrome C oxidase subunit IV family protein [Candidatus Binataceae bacterium]
MSEEVLETTHPGMPAHVAEENHPGPVTYIVVALILTALTAMEITVFYVPQLQPVLVPLLIVLAICKFVLVAMFYMHLHYDSHVFSALFIAPLWVALLIVVTLMLLFYYLSGHLSFVVPPIQL